MKFEPVVQKEMSFKENFHPHTVGRATDYGWRMKLFTIAHLEPKAHGELKNNERNIKQWINNK